MTAFYVTRATLIGLKEPLWRGKVWDKSIHGIGSRDSFWGHATFLVRFLAWARTHLRRTGFRRRTIPCCRPFRRNRLFVARCICFGPRCRSACRLPRRGRMPSPALLRAIPFRRQGNAYTKRDFEARSYFAPAIIGLTCRQRSHK